MIGWLNGQVVERDAGQGTVIVDVRGVGYEVRLSLQTLAAVGEAGSECALWVYTHVRAESLALFGFSTPAEKQLFLLLLRVPKVGPQSALAVLGGFPLSELVRVLVRGDQKTLQKIPGIGRKTAEQILLSLKDKAEELFAVIDEEAAAAGGEARAPVQRAAPEDALKGDAQLVLVNLGWRAKQVEAALAKVLESRGDERWTLDELVRRALAQLMER